MTSFLKQLAKAVIGRSAIVDIVPPVQFVGWKIATGTRVPWHVGGSNTLAQAFARCDQELAGHIASRKVVLTQFRPKSVASEVAQLRWRHYLVYWSATVAYRIAGSGSRNFVEMGVCDGLTVWFYD